MFIQNKMNTNSTYPACSKCWHYSQATPLSMQRTCSTFGMAATVAVTRAIGEQQVAACYKNSPNFSDISSIHADLSWSAPKPSVPKVPVFMRKAKSWHPVAPPKLFLSLAPCVSPNHNGRYQQTSTMQKGFRPALAPNTSRRTHKTIRKAKSMCYSVQKQRARLGGVVFTPM